MRYLSLLLKSIVIVVGFVMVGYWVVKLDLPSLAAPAVRKQVIISNNPELRLYGMDWMPPRLELSVVEVTMPYQQTEVVLQTDEDIMPIDLPSGWQVLEAWDAQPGELVIAITNVPDGDHAYELKFVDSSDNISQVQLQLHALPNRPQITTWENTKYVLHGQSLTALVNKKYRLLAAFEPTDLVYIADHGMKVFNNARIRQVVLKDLQEMTTAIKAAGIDYSITSGYRSFSDQINAYNYWLDVYDGDFVATDQVSARPGYSEHQLGLTIDFVTSASSNTFAGFELTALSTWLNENAYKYGFVMSYPAGKSDITGYAYEPWHYRYVGKENALSITQSELTPTEWLLQYNSN